MLGDVEKKAVFVNVDKGSDKCRFAIEILMLSPEEQSAWEDKFKGKFVQLRQSLFLLKSQQSALVSQVFNTKTECEETFLINQKNIISVQSSLYLAPKEELLSGMRQPNGGQGWAQSQNVHQL